MVTRSTHFCFTSVPTVRNAISAVFALLVMALLGTANLPVAHAEDYQPTLDHEIQFAQKAVVKVNQNVLLGQPFTPEKGGHVAKMVIFQWLPENSTPEDARIASAEIHAFKSDGSITSVVSTPIENGVGEVSTPLSVSENRGNPVEILFPNLPTVEKGTRYVLVLNPMINGNNKVASLSTNILWGGNQDRNRYLLRKDGDNAWAGANTEFLYYQLWLAPPAHPEDPSVIAADQCGVQKTVNLPEVKGVSYSTQKTGNEATVTATAKAGYFLEDGSKTEWKFDISPTPCPIKVTPVQPEFHPATCENEATWKLPKVKGIVYETEIGPNKVTITAQAEKGYELVKTTAANWIFDTHAPANCQAEVASPTYTDTIAIGENSSLGPDTTDKNNATAPTPALASTGSAAMSLGILSLITFIIGGFLIHYSNRIKIAKN